MQSAGAAVSALTASSSLRDTPLDIASHVWECANCEYLRLNPDGKRGIAYPREMPKAKLQKDVLF